MPTTISGGENRHVRRTFQKLRQVIRKDAQKKAEAVLGLPQLRFESRTEAEVSLRVPLPGSVSNREALAVAKPVFSNPEILFLCLHVLAGNIKPLLKSSDRDIGIRHIGREAHQGAVVIGHSRKQICIG